MRRVHFTTALLVIVAGLAGCAAGPVGGPVPNRGVPGFDTRDYPGDAAMRTWFAESPYRWVGYYLPAPCYTGTTWQGKRSTLRGMGWGFGVLFVGEQDWSAMRAVGADTGAVAVENARCSTRNLTAANAVTHAADAARAAAAEGFPAGTVIFLDVERVETVSDPLAQYVRAWSAALLADGRYVPGIYAHDRNAAALITILTEEFLRVQRVEQPRLWVAGGAGFDIGRSPVESGYPVASVWQGVFDTRQNWGGHELLIDVNVAASADPSRGR